MREVRKRLKAQGRTFREAVIEGLRRTLLTEESAGSFALRDAAFAGEVGFAEGFHADDLTAAVYADAEQRFDPDTER